MNAIEPHEGLPLYPNEKVLWTGAPTKSRPEIGFGLLVALGMSLFGLAVSVWGETDGFNPFMLIFLLGWEAITLRGPVLWLRAWRTSRTTRVAATDRRILVTYNDRGPQSLSYEYKQLGPPQVVGSGIQMELLGAGEALVINNLPDPLILQDLITRVQAEDAQ